jgi:hypothetical protein
MKSGSLNLLEPSGPRRACYGTPDADLLGLVPIADCHEILCRFSRLFDANGGVVMEYAAVSVIRKKLSLSVFGVV